MNDFVLYTERCGDRRVVMQAVMGQLHTSHCGVFPRWWSAESRKQVHEAAKAAGRKLTDDEAAAINTRVWTNDLNIAATDRWGYRVEQVVCYNPDSGKIYLTVAPDASEDETYDAMWALWDHFDHDSKLKAADLRPVVERAAAEAVPFQYDMGVKMTADELLQFVHGYMAGHVYLGVDCGSDAGLVFMPLMFGAFNLPEGTVHPLSLWLPKAGDEPKCPSRPAATPQPNRPKRGPKPKPPAALTPDPETMRGFDDLSWDDPDAADAKRAAYLADHANSTKVLESQWQQAVKDWEDDKPYRAKLAAWKEACKAVRDEYALVCKEYDKVVAAWQADHDRWKRESTLEDIAYTVFNSVRLSDLGDVWADTTKDKPMPRCINGKPMFGSMRLISKADLAKARKLIDAEFKRRAEQKALLEQDDAE